MEYQLISIYISIVSVILAFTSGILALIVNNRSAKKIQDLKNSSAKELEYLRCELKRAEESESLKRRYSLPLLKTAEELHNKLNDIVSNHKRVLKYFKALSQNLGAIDSIGKILTSPTKVYITNILFLFARYFAIIESIKKELGLIPLAEARETKSLYVCMRRTVAVFFSGRLHKNLSIRKPNQIKYQGRILEGAQTIIGESMFRRNDGPYECISYYEFCAKIVSDKDFLQCLSPITTLLQNLEVVPDVNKNIKDVDFRWAKILFFSFFLRELVEEIDTAQATVLLTEIRKEVKAYLEHNPFLKENLAFFKKTYGGG